LKELKSTVKTDIFDVIGHLTYPVRYIKRDGAQIDLSDFYQEITEVLKMIIQKGKA
jgi:histidinol phosphatase-like PHP family hydrolase